MARTKSIRYKDGTYYFTGDLGDALEKARRDIENNEKYLDYYKWNYEKAKKEYDSRVNKIKINQDFINCIKTQESDWFDQFGNYIPGSYEKKFSDEKER